MINVLFVGFVTDGLDKIKCLLCMKAYFKNSNVGRFALSH